MFGFFKSEDEAPISPPVKGSWEFNFNKELQAAVKRREKLNKKLEDDMNDRKASTDSTTSVDITASRSSYSSLGLPQSTHHTPLTSPSQLIQVASQFTYSPRNSNSSLTPPKLSPPFDSSPEKSPTNLSTSSPVEVRKSKTLPSDVNLQVGNDLPIGKRVSLALDKRNTSVMNMISMFNSQKIEEDPSTLLRKRATTVSTAQNDINASKTFYYLF